MHKLCSKMMKEQVYGEVLRYFLGVTRVLCAMFWDFLKLFNTFAVPLILYFLRVNWDPFETDLVISESCSSYRK